MTQSNFNPWLGDGMVKGHLSYTAYLVFLFCFLFTTTQLLMPFYSKVHRYGLISGSHYTAQVTQGTP